MLVCQFDNQLPKAPLKFEPAAFLVWIAKQSISIGTIHCCYEAGCFSFVLHRKLEAIGVKNLVVRPRDSDVPSLGDDTRAKRRHTDQK